MTPEPRVEKTESVCVEDDYNDINDKFVKHRRQLRLVNFPLDNPLILQHSTVSLTVKLAGVGKFLIF